MTYYKLPQEVLETLVNYLASKPFAEVAQGIATLQRLEKVTPEISDAKEPIQNPAS